MNPAWSVVFFTTLVGAGQGLFLALFVGHAPARLMLAGILLALALLASGLAASFFHLGRPVRAWRAASMWRTSWLSREVIVLPLFMALVAAYGGWPFELLGWLAVTGCFMLFVCTGMIYACLPFLQEWRTPLTVLNFMLLGTASGLTLATALAAWLHAPLARPFATAALAVGALAYLGRIASLARNARLRPKSTLATAIGVKHPHIVQIAQGAMGGSFNTREFFHCRPRETARMARWAMLLLAFPAPSVLLAFGGESAAAAAAAFILQYAGLVAERWYFFAEARHPQNLYYQRIA